MFQPTYNFFNETVTCRASQVTVNFHRESKVVHWIIDRANKQGWKCIPIETEDKRGFPDLLLLRAKEYWQIEVKHLKKKQLITIQDDLRWQKGQLPYMKRALTLDLNYMLAVGKDNQIAFIKGENNAKRSDYPDYTRLI